MELYQLELYQNSSPLPPPSPPVMQINSFLATSSLDCLVGQNLAIYNSQTVSSCAALCLSMSTCGGFTFHNPDGSCYPKAFTLTGVAATTSTAGCATDSACTWYTLAPPSPPLPSSSSGCASATTLTGVASDGTMAATGSLTMGPYSNYWDCFFLLLNPNQYTFNFAFPVYSVENYYDWVQVGGVQGVSFTNNTSSFLVHFHSDGSVTYSGFTLTWNQSSIVTPPPPTSLSVQQAAAQSACFGAVGAGFGSTVNIAGTGSNTYTVAAGSGPISIVYNWQFSDVLMANDVGISCGNCGGACVY